MNEQIAKSRSGAEKMISAKRIGSIISEERKKLGYSQAIFGAFFGFSRFAVVNWEQGKRKPTLQELCNFTQEKIEINLDEVIKTLIKYEQGNYETIKKSLPIEYIDGKPYAKMFNVSLEYLLGLTPIRKTRSISEKSELALDEQLGNISIDTLKNVLNLGTEIQKGIDALEDQGLKTTKDYQYARKFIANRLEDFNIDLTNLNDPLYIESMEYKNGIKEIQEQYRKNFKLCYPDATPEERKTAKTFIVEHHDVLFDVKRERIKSILEHKAIKLVNELIGGKYGNLF